MPYQLLRLPVLRSFVFIVACLICIIAQGKTVTINNGGHYPLTEYLMVLEDPSNSLTFEQIKNHSFSDLKKSVPKLGARTSTWWVKFDLKLLADDTPWYIQLNYPHIKSVDLFHPNDDSNTEASDTKTSDTDTSYTVLHSGYETLSKERDSNTQGFIFPLIHTKNKTQTFYFKIVSDSPIMIPLAAVNADQLLSSERFSSYAHGSFYGIFAVMGLFNLFIFFTTREKSYLFYVFYIASIFLFTLSSDGALRKIIPFVNPASISYGFNMIMAMGPVAFGALFCQNFLHTKENQPIIHKILWSIIFLCIINTLLLITLNSYPFHSSVVILTFLLSGTALTAGAIALKHNLSIARFFLVAWACLVIGSVLWLLTLMGIIPFNEYSSLSAHTGAALETILLSMALGDRINQTRKEKQAIEAEAKEQLEESNRLLAGSNHFKDEFLSVISHELRTPMNGVYGATELLEFTNLDEEQQDHIKTIKRSSDDMLNMVEDILTFTQSEAGTLSQHNEPIELAPLIQRLSKEIEMRCTVRNIAYTIEIEANIPPIISCDKSKLVIILSHLLDNAVKFTENGHITLNISPVSKAKKTVKKASSSELSMDLRFTISDSGCGVPLDQQKFVFESFRQLDGSLTRQHGGLGIGLALCKRIVDVLNGTLTFESKIGVGTTVSVDLLVGVPEEQRLQSTASEPPSAIISGKHILVVEDNYVNKLVIAGILKKMQLTVSTCSDGREAVDFVKNNEIDLILMDCQMPVMDGYDASRAIRKISGAMAQVPIIAVTANANPGDRLLCLEAGMNDYLKKPITHALLAEKIGKWF